MIRARTYGAMAMAMSLVGTAYGGDHPVREAPPYAFQPPGASFERTITRRQWLILLRETLHQTCDEFVHAPVRSLGNGSARLLERAGVKWAACAARPEPAGAPVPGGRRPAHAGPAHAALRQRPCVRGPDGPDRLGAMPHRPDDVRLGGRPGRPPGRRGTHRAGPGRRVGPGHDRPRRLRHRRDQRPRVPGCPVVHRRPRGRAERPPHPDARSRLPLRSPQARRHRRPDRLVGLTDPDEARGRALAQLQLPGGRPDRRGARVGLRRALGVAGRLPGTALHAGVRGGRRRPERRRPRGQNRCRPAGPDAQGGRLRLRQHGPASHLPREPLLQRPDPDQEAGGRAGARGATSAPCSPCAATAHDEQVLGADGQRRSSRAGRGSISSPR